MSLPFRVVHEQVSTLESFDLVRVAVLLVLFQTSARRPCRLSEAVFDPLPVWMFMYFPAPIFSFTRSTELLSQDLHPGFTKGETFRC